MDARHFDRLTRSLAAGSSRRTVLAGLLAGILAPIVSVGARAADRHHGKRKHKGRGTDKGKSHGRRRKTNAQAVPARCFGSGACLPGPAAYLAKCDFTDSNVLENVNCTGCNLSDSSLLRADASGANFNKANLSRVCLVDADLTSATINASTNLLGAVFCRTKMPNGSINNSGCTKATGCCPTCVEPGNSGCNVGGCCAGNVCCNNVCCQAGDVCNTNKIPNACCTPVPNAVACANKCGPGVSDGCVGTYDCGDVCSNPTPICSASTHTCEACTSNGQCGVDNVCCQGSCRTCCLATCQSLGRECGTAPDGCGGTLSCGMCSGSTANCNNGTCTNCASMCSAACFACCC